MKKIFLSLGMIFAFAGTIFAGDSQVNLFRMIDDNDVIGLRSEIERGLELDVEYAFSKDAGPVVRVPLMIYAVAQVKPDIVEEMIRAGANTEVTWLANHKQTPLLVAVAKVQQEKDPQKQREALNIIKILIDGGANVNARSGSDPSGMAESGFTPLHEAVSIENLEHALAVSKLLIQHGADVNATTDRSGITPMSLHSSQGGDRSSLRKLLVEAGAK